MSFALPTLCLAASLPSAAAGDVHLTIYNQNFAVVREVVGLDLKQGVNRISYANMTAHAEPDSVILRDPSGKRMLQILEQNYRADPISQELLLSVFEGKTIDFLLYSADKVPEVKKGRIVRSGYTPHSRGLSVYGDDYYRSQMQMSYGGGGQPIIEVDGQLRFGLPGQPLFPSLGDDTILKPTLEWSIASEEAAPLDAELAYVTGGMGWQADYNVIAPEKGEVVDLIGWVTLDNQSGKTFEGAHVKLMAGDVNKLQPDQRNRAANMLAASSAIGVGARGMTEKAFDEFHLYSIERPTTVRDRETKQVELVRGAGITGRRLYVYDGASIDWSQYDGRNSYSWRAEASLGTQSNPKIWVMREIANTEANHLGLPLPKGRVRFYQRDTDGRLEFVGENLIDHTPKDETLRVYTGNSFDLVGQRTRSSYKVDSNNRWVDETFEIEVRNHKKDAVDVRVVEHLYRWSNWEITMQSSDWHKRDSQTIEFTVTVPPDGSKKVSYAVHYSW
jgi:hypothetical protein